MSTIKKNIFLFHTNPAALVGYDYKQQVPSILFDELTSTMDPWEEIVDKFEQNRSTLGKDLDVALRAAEIYKNKHWNEKRRLWPVGGEVEMALLHSPRHRADYLKYDVGSQLQSDPRYIDILRQLDPVFVAKYLGIQEAQSYHVNPDFKHTVLKMLSKDIAASIIYSAESRKRNTLIEPVLLRMSEDDWQDLTKNPQINHHSITRRQGLAAYYKTAWQYYLRCLNSQDVRNAISDARSAGFSQAGWIESDGQN
jgi:hypothetical protein